MLRFEHFSRIYRLGVWPTMRTSLSVELRLALACAIWPQSQQRLAAIRKAAQANIDWHRFLKLVSRHRIWSLVNDGLTRAGITLPPDIAQSLAAQAALVARQSLAMAAETIRLQKAFEEAGIAALFVKGATLAMLAYGNIGIRHSKDIDLLVDKDNAEKAHSLMELLGYERFSPPRAMTADRMRLWYEYSKESEFIHPNSNLRVELHWRLTDNPYLLDKVTMASATQRVALAAGAAPLTLSRDALFAYLCAHGAKHSWFRLKWLADIAAMLANKSETEIVELYRGAHAMGGGRSVDQALLLCESLFDAGMPNELSVIMHRDWKTRRLVSMAMTALTRGDELADVYDAHLGKALSQLSLILLSDDWGYRLSQLRCMMTGVDDISAISLPRPLWFIYPVLRLPMWLWRHAYHAKY